MSRGRALAELVLSAILFGVMAWLARRATREVGGAQAAFVRFAVCLVVIGVAASARLIRLQPRRWDLLALRGVLGSGAVLCYFIAIEHVPVGTATLLHHTAPVWTAMFASLFLGERVPLVRAGALLAAGAGVSLVVYGQGRAFGGGHGWQLMALGSALISGAAVTAIRAARRHDRAWEVFTAFSALGALCTLPLAAIQWRSPTPNGWLLLVGVGLLSVAAQVVMTHALGTIEAATGAVVNQLTVITAMAFGVFVDEEPLSVVSFLGAVLTLVGVTLAARVSDRTRPAS